MPAKQPVLMPEEVNKLPLGASYSASEIRMTMLKLLSGKFCARVTVLAGSTALARVITVAVSPFLTRLYRPEVRPLGAYMAVLG